MSEEQNQDEGKRGKRSQLKKELDAVGELVRILKPLDSEQRERMLRTATFMIGGEEGK